ncbi:type I toxin-antitoxin system SymE family toxin [Pantoea anthophila]|uniref:type I toxin-antitoxin system SymE family toxin n=1 Tax=Pantoea anthophila TaxID=470931 RepID=UPI00215A1B88|nr:type I toxin-antitoxin system SymE family toxin [Pantoea anthophila]MEB5705644.1 type I toxin-antitoxin system SymE family toxin [Pantoea anthophila]MEB6516514.1 type I toxin-antitoxin system SymE family toxin [Pantoea anthophila]WIM56413.1 type I toxin-antitoxin system SymE family toxin [Pantoea anthophila]
MHAQNCRQQFTGALLQRGIRPDKGQPNPLPQLTINGRWLEALRFTTGQKIEVITRTGQLIIRLTNEG